MIIGTTGKKLDAIVGEMKSYTSTQFKKIIKDHPHESRKEWIMWLMERVGKKKNGNNNDWQFWQQHNKPLEIKNQEMFNKTLEYIHQNPVQASFVTKPEDWKWISARDFWRIKGLIDYATVNIRRHKRTLAPIKGLTKDSK